MTKREWAELREELIALREEVRQLRLSQSFNQRVVYVPQPYPVYPQPYYQPWQQQPYWQTPIYSNAANANWQISAGNVQSLGGGHQT